MQVFPAKTAKRCKRRVPIYVEIWPRLADRVGKPVAC